MLQTPLHDFHRSLGARMVEFAGWEMPLLYTSIIEEHHHTRTATSVFDVSHMGRVEFRGAAAESFLERLCTRRLSDMKVGVSRYSHVCREDGGILDDVIVSKLDDYWLMVCNASNRLKLLAWFEQHRQGVDVQINDVTFATAMVAVQGPRAVDSLAAFIPVPLADLKRYHFKTGKVLGQDYYVARSGYTGEDGYEAILPARLITTLAHMLLEQSKDAGIPIKPAGLGARDTLRLEAAMPLYGHELMEEWDSITAGQAWCVDLTKDFIGAAAMRAVKETGPRRHIVGFELEGKRVGRQGAEVFHEGRAVGVVTSGTHSPTFDKVLGLALVESRAGAIGTKLEVDLRGARAAGTVVSIPFYKRAK